MDPECGFIAAEPAHPGAASDTTFLLGELLKSLQLWSLRGENYQIMGSPWEEDTERGGHGSLGVGSWASLCEPRGR